MRYRRLLQPGGTYFFTLVLANRRQSLLTDKIDLLRQAYRKVIKAHPVKTIAIVILHDHLHAIWQLPKGDSNYAMRWRLIKSEFSRKIPNQESCSTSRLKKVERGIWQRRYWEHLIRDQDDLNNHINYIHYNPIKHGYVTNAIDWPFSTYKYYAGFNSFALSKIESEVLNRLYDD